MSPTIVFIDVGLTIGYGNGFIICFTNGDAIVYAINYVINYVTRPLDMPSARVGRVGKVRCKPELPLNILLSIPLPTPLAMQNPLLSSLSVLTIQVALVLAFPSALPMTMSLAMPSARSFAIPSSSPFAMPLRLSLMTFLLSLTLPLTKPLSFP